MKTTLYLIRHGVTRHNKENRFQGRGDTVLHEHGELQALRLRERMKNVHVDAVYSSPLKRAVRTAEIAFPSHDIIIDESLKERSYGIIEGILIEDFKQNFPSHVVDKFYKSRHLDVEGAEGIEELERRAVEAMKRIAEANKGKKVAIVAHGGIFNAFYLAISGRQKEDYQMFRSSNASVTEVIYEDEKWILKSFDDTSHMSVHASAPGKMMIAGEWAVLEVGNPCIVAAVNKRVHAVVSESRKMTVEVDDFNIKNVEAQFDGQRIEWLNAEEKQKEKLIFLKGAIETTLQYIGDYRPFHIRGWGEDTSVYVDGVQKKIGFGSSAASVVAAVTSIMAFHGYELEKELIYKLSAIAHYFAQGKVGSAFDVAASTYGGISVYKRFDSKWLVEELQQHTVREIAEKKWPHFYSEQLPLDDEMKILIAWTKESASTVNLVREMDNFKKSQPDEYGRIYSQIAQTVTSLISAWKSSDKEIILKLLKQNKMLLTELTEKSGLPIEIHSLRLLADVPEGAAAKLSGAGGGDCGIAVCYDSATASEIKEKWAGAGLYPLDVSIDKEGVKIH